MSRMISSKVLRASASVANKLVQAIFAQDAAVLVADRPQIGVLEPRQLLSRAVGIDVSHYQGTVNWTNVHNSGKQFAYVKSTEGVGVTDATLTSNMTNGAAVGMLLGVYHHATPATTTNDAINEANYFVQIAGQYMTEGYLRPAVDISQGSAIGKTAMSTWVNTFLSTVKNATGVEPIIYTNNDYVTNYFDSTVVNHTLWISRWSSAYGDPLSTGSPPTGVWGSNSKTWNFWQYSSTGTVAGISGGVDLDVYSGDMTQLQTMVVPPALTITGAATVNEGSNYTLGLSATSLGQHTVSSWAINWGDGSGVQTVTGNPSSITHVFANGPLSASISATEIDDLGSHAVGSTVAVSVANVAPVITPPPASVAAEPGGTFLLPAITFTDAGSTDAATATVNWGDGSTAESATITPNSSGSGGTISGNHQYAAFGSYSAVVTLTDSDGGLTQTSVPVEIATANVAAVSYEDETAQRVRVTFNSHDDNVNGQWLVMRNLTTGTIYSASSQIFAWDSETTGSFTFSTLLPDGNYIASVGVQEAPLAVWQADFNHDNIVDVTDLGILSSHWQQTGMIHSQGDANYDGIVDVVDLGILSSKWQAILAKPATPGDISVSPMGTDTIAASWIKVPGAEGYRVQISTDGENFTFLRNVLGEDSTATVEDGLNDGTRYWFRVRAYGNDQDTSYTDKKVATTVLISPTELTASVVSDGGVDLAWSDNSVSVTSYDVFTSLSATGPWTLAGTTPDNVASFRYPAGSQSNVRYFYVTAKNSVAASSPSQVTEVDFTAVPNAPSSLTSHLAGGNSVLNWASTGNDITAFRVYESTDGGVTFNYIDSTDSTTTSYAVSDLSPGTTPQFYVTALNTSGESHISNIVSQSIPASLQNTQVVLNDDATIATVSWTPDPNAHGYFIYRVPDNGSASATLLATLQTGSAYQYVDGTVDPTQAYTFLVTPYYSSIVPADSAAAGTGATENLDDYTGDVKGLKTEIRGNNWLYVSWLYQGEATFEIEDKDKDAEDTNFALVTNTDNPRDREVVTYVLPGEHYSLRMRAMRSDGTASDYVSTSVDVPALVSPTLTLEGSPTISLNPYDGIHQPTGSISSATLNYTPANSVWHVQVKREGDTYGVMQEYFDTVDQPVYSSQGQTVDFDYVVASSTGATSQVSISFWERPYNVDFQRTEWSSPATYTEPGVKPPKLTLTADEPDTNGDVAINWATPANVTSGIVKFYWIGRNNGQPVANMLALTADVTSDRYVIHRSDLPAGTHKLFAITEGAYDRPLQYGMSDYSNEVTVKHVIPNNPAYISGVYDPSVPKGQIKLHWANSSDNETGFQIFRRKKGESNFTSLTSVGADVTSYIDNSLPDNGPWEYEVQAVNQNYKSDFAISTSINVIGGPDVSKHLVTIRKDLNSWYRGLPLPQQLQFKAEWIWATGDLLKDPVKTSNNAGNWDIPILRAGVSTSENSGVLPNGMKTVSILGGVYQGNFVNYWLYGCIASMVGADQGSVHDLIAFRDNNVQVSAGHMAWFDAGYANNLTLPASWSLTISGPPLIQYTYGTLPNVSGAASPPVAIDTGKLKYHAGNSPVQTGTREG